MKAPDAKPLPSRADRGSVLIIVLWICLGLVALVLYFGNTITSELRATANRVGDTEARQAVAGGIRYAEYILTQFGTGGQVPNEQDYRAEEMPVGGATFWFVGRDPNAPLNTTEPYFGIVDESSKLNLNRASSSILQGLPGMTADIADSIVAWRTASSASTSGNADNIYARLDPPRMNKGAAFETVDELRLVYGMTLDVLLGEDTNRNGVLDSNEDDGEASPPYDDHDGQLLAGVLEHVTVYSKLPTTGKVNVANIAQQQVQTRLRTLMTNAGIDSGRAQQIIQIFLAQGPQGQANPPQNVADFMVRSRLSVDEYDLIYTGLTDGANQTGRVNVNTASETVLACIFGAEDAAAMVAYRTANKDNLKSMAWLTTAGVTQATISRVGALITDQSYQFSVDVAAVGRYGRGYARERVVFDMSTGTPRIVYRQDLSSAGWALGSKARQQIKAAKDTSS